ncbi:20004_t:CDS:10 [Funneliformis geosporum]|uniref:20004_t:CDS:1 n=1 Tax=Funneliformis geosporum TaxID=1117311 RepID=A0A9W4WRM9_9GLOM|nr:20004_t:CDS:10 [Funneliformis geosporum]
MTTIKINNWVKTDENDFTSTSVIKLESFNYKGELISGIKVEDKVIKGQFKKFIPVEIELNESEIEVKRSTSGDARDGIFKIKIEEKGLVENSYTPKVNSIKMPFNVSQLGDYNAYLEKGKLVIGSDGGSAIPKLKVVDENPEFPHPDKKQAASQGNDRQRVRKAITQAGEAKKKLFVFGYGNKSKEDFEDAVQALNDLIKIAKDGSSTNQSSPDQGKPGNDSGNNKKRKNENEDNNHSREPKRTKIEEEIKQNQAKSDEKNSNKLVNDLTNFNSKNEAEKKQSLADIERLKNQGGVYESQKEQVKEKKDEAAKSDPQGYGKMIAQIIRQKINEFKVEITKLGEKINTKLAQLENGEVTSDTEVRSIEEEISEEVSQEVANVETNNLLTQAQNLLKGASTYQSKKKEIEQTLSKLEIVSQNTNQSTKSSPFRSEVIIPVGLGLLMITESLNSISVKEKDLTTYLKHCGFILPNAEIYGGLANSPYNIGCDSQIITHPQVLEASEEYIRFLEKKDQDNYLVSDNCLKCGKNKFCSPRQFNLLLTTNLEITEGKENIVYLRPETCQGIFVNFPSIQRSTHRPLPFGIGQMGKSFRNEITLHHGIFRTREFEQMELEFFCQSEEIDLKNEELPHYAKKTQDLYFQYHFGWGELCSNSHRGNYDLSQHRQHSGKDFRINGIIPEVVESSFGVERLMLAILEDSYQKETIKNAQGEESEREVLKLSPLLAPYLVAVIPLEKSLREKSHQLYCELLKNPLFSVAYEETGNIGNRYRRQDAIGTYYCLTLDKQTLQDNTVTLRHLYMKNTDDNLSPNKKKEPGSDALIYLLLFMLVALLVGVSPTADEVIKLIQGNRNRRKTAKRILAGEMRGRTLTNQEKKEVEKELAMINEKWAENLQGFNMKEIEKENPTVLAKIYAGLYEQGKITTRLKYRTSVSRPLEELKKQEQIQKGKKVTELTPELINEYKKKSVFQQKDGTSKTIDYSQTLKIKFNGYSGFLTEKEKKNSSEGKEVFGLTTSDGVSFVSDQNHKVKLEKDTTNPVEGSIIPSEYYLVKTIGGRTYHDICFEECLETMAHELAHAIVGNIKGEYEGEEGGEKAEKEQQELAIGSIAVKPPSHWDE